VEVSFIGGGTERPQENRTTPRKAMTKEEKKNNTIQNKTE
jgi:hypothetical protein